MSVGDISLVHGRSFQHLLALTETESVSLMSLLLSLLLTTQFSVTGTLIPQVGVTLSPNLTEPVSDGDGFIVHRLPTAEIKLGVYRFKCEFIGGRPCRIYGGGPCDFSVTLRL